MRRVTRSQPVAACVRCYGDAPRHAADKAMAMARAARKEGNGGGVRACQQTQCYLKAAFCVAQRHAHDKEAARAKRAHAGVAQQSRSACRAHDVTRTVHGATLAPHERVGKEVRQQQYGSGVVAAALPQTEARAARCAAMPRMCMRQPPRARCAVARVHECDAAAPQPTPRAFAAAYACRRRAQWRGAVLCAAQPVIRASACQRGSACANAPCKTVYAARRTRAVCASRPAACVAAQMLMPLHITYFFFSLYFPFIFFLLLFLFDYIFCHCYHFFIFSFSFSLSFSFRYHSVHIFIRV